VTVEDTEITCTGALPGAGRNLDVRVLIGPFNGNNGGGGSYAAYLSESAWHATTLAYPPPLITGLSAANGYLPTITYYSSFSITGSCLGAASWNWLQSFALGDARGAPGSWTFPFTVPRDGPDGTLARCQLSSTKGDTISCNSVELIGPGQALQALLSVGPSWNKRQYASPSEPGDSTTLRFVTPTCLLVMPASGAASAYGPTNGTRGIIIYGNDFGVGNRQPLHVYQRYTDVLTGVELPVKDEASGCIVYSANERNADDDEYNSTLHYPDSYPTELNVDQQNAFGGPDGGFHCTSKIVCESAPGGGAEPHYEVHVGATEATSTVFSCARHVTQLLTQPPSNPAAIAATPLGGGISTAGGTLVHITGSSFGCTNSIVTATFGVPYAYGFADADSAAHYSDDKHNTTTRTGVCGRQCSSRRLTAR
jgi:hypothetical protein